MEILERLGKYNKETGEGIRIVSEIPVDKPCVFYIGGKQCNDEKVANGYAHGVNEVVGDNALIYAVMYDKKDVENAEEQRLYEFARNAQITSGLENRKEQAIERRQIVKNAPENIKNPEYIKNLFDMLILPRISSNNGAEKINYLQACQNIRAATIVTHCHGSFVAFKLEQMMDEKLKDLGYSDFQSKRIQSQMVVMSNQSRAPLGLNKTTHISFNSLADVFATTLPFQGDREEFKSINHLGVKILEDMEGQIPFCYLKKFNLFLGSQFFKDGKYDFLRSREHNVFSLIKTPGITKIENKEEDLEETEDGIIASRFKMQILKQSVAMSKNKKLIENGIEDLLSSSKPFTNLYKRMSILGEDISLQVSKILKTIRPNIAERQR